MSGPSTFFNEVIDARKGWSTRAFERSLEAIDVETEETVRKLIADVRNRGDEAVLDAARRFDAPNLSSVVVTTEEFERADVTADLREAINVAHGRVRAFHEAQRNTFMSGLSQGPAFNWAWFTPDGSAGQRVLPIASIGLYVPGGRASYPSTVLMLAGPATAAGVPRLACATPVRSDGSVHPAVLVVLRLCSVTNVVKVGGAAAIAAMAIGTQSIERVDKIVGPGNRFVNEAKRQLWGQVGLDGYAGPSEVCVIADKDANAKFVAADLLTQIEHAPDNLAYLIVLSDQKRLAIEAEIEALASSVRGGQQTLATLQRFGVCIMAYDVSAACQIANEIAAEHVSVALTDPNRYLPQLRNAGAILVGEWTPESVSDYVLGPSHTLPTAGSARFASSLNVMDFLKVQTLGRLDHAQLEPLIDAVSALGDAEGFPMHARGATIRRS